MTKPLEPLNIGYYEALTYYTEDGSSSRKLDHDQAIRALFEHSQEQDRIINSLLGKEKI